MNLVRAGRHLSRVGLAVVLAGCSAAAPVSPSPEPTIPATPRPASPTPTQAPTAARPTSTPAAGLPEGPFEFEDLGMAMTVTIPASGWTFDSSWTFLTKGIRVKDVPEAGIAFWHWPAGTRFYVPGDPCQATSTRPDTPATTVDDFVAALASQSSRDASEPADVNVGGYAGKSITLHVPDDAGFDQFFGECEQSAFITYGTEEHYPARQQQGPGQIEELSILDVDGATVIVHAMYRPDTPTELVDEMRGIVESTTFEVP